MANLIEYDLYLKSQTKNDRNPYDILRLVFVSAYAVAQTN